MSEMRDAVIVDAVRSPMTKGKANGALAGLHPVELLRQVLEGLISRNAAVDPGTVEDVITGCVSQVSEQGYVPGRMAWLGAGFPEHVPATMIDRRCGSSQQAADFAAWGVMVGAYDTVVACGIESMSRVPIGSAREGADAYGPSTTARYAPGLIPQGVSAELIANKWGFTREELDAFSAESHRRAAEAADSGAFDDEILPITVETEEGSTVVERDETIRPNTTVEKLGELPPSFETPEYTERFPEVSPWKIHAGNSSQLTDGASAVLIMSEERASQLGLRPRARLHSFAVIGDDPLFMLTGPIPATQKVLERSGLKIDEIDHYEVNEAFAPVPLAWQRELDADPKRLNPRGGGIALGHPLGATGGRLLTTMVNALEAGGGRFGLQTMCEGGGMANATIIERL